MLNCLVLICAILGQSVLAHFSIEYPEWRGDSFIEPASQYIRPCKSSNLQMSRGNWSASPGAGINQTISGNNRTLWPLDGGSLNLEFHHEFTYAFINLGLGSNATVFNISLTTPPLNETGNGTFCFPKVQLPTDLNLQDGDDASIQVVTVGETGTALYNVSQICPPGSLVLTSRSIVCGYHFQQYSDLVAWRSM